MLSDGSGVASGDGAVEASDLVVGECCFALPFFCFPRFLDEFLDTYGYGKRAQDWRQGVTMAYSAETTEAGRKEERARSL